MMKINNLLKKGIIALATLTCTTVASAQITAPGSDKKYDTGIAAMPAFIYYSASESATSATLNAIHPLAGTNADFVWEMYDNTTSSYTLLANTGNVSSIGTGSYRVSLTNVGGGVYNDTVMYAAVIMDVLAINSITPDNVCGTLRLDVSTTAKTTYLCYDISQSPVRTIFVSTGTTIEWQSTPTDIYDGLPITPYWKNPMGISQQTARTTISDPAPLVAASYTATVKNAFGNSATAGTPQIPAISVYPVMKVEEKSGETWTETTTVKGSALYRLRFDHSQSKNADTYTWIGMDNINNVQTRGKVLWLYTSTSISEKVYPKYMYQGEELDGYLPGKYPDSLIVKNSATGCVAKVDLKSVSPDVSYIEVLPSKFDPNAMPNVFTPNGDGVNDLFKFVRGQEPVSIKTIDLHIFNRGGKELYHYNGRSEDWQGWNGKMKGTGADCSPGVYYYIISAQGWDNISYSGGQYKGFLHLFRE